MDGVTSVPGIVLGHLQTLTHLALVQPFPVENKYSSLEERCRSLWSPRKSGGSIDSRGASQPLCDQYTTPT